MPWKGELMARNYGQIVATIWRDPDFQKLPIVAQWVYIMLATQGDISSCGLLSVTLGRWANYASDLTRDALSDALSTLSDQRFVIVDWDTEELLVRSFTKWDGGSTNSKRRPAIVAAAESVVSPVIRGVLAVELDKLSVPHALLHSPSDTASHDPSDTPSDRGSIGQGSGYVSSPDTGTLNRNHDLKPESLAIAIRDAPTAQTIVAEWLERTPKRPPGTVIGQVARSVDVMLGEGIDPDDLRRGLGAWMAKGLHPSTLPSVVNEVMNAGSRGRAQDETDAMFARAAQRLGVAQ